MSNVEAERLAMTAYLGHLDHCGAGCRPAIEPRRNGSFVPGTGNGCPIGLRLADAWQRVQDARRSEAAA